MNTQTSYDAVAAEYAKRFADELNHKPFDRDLPVTGLDLSHGLLSQARQLHPMLRFQQGNMRFLPFADYSCSA